jgi:DNA modification methylase
MNATPLIYPTQLSLSFADPQARLTLPGLTPYYCTPLGEAYVTDALALLKAIPDAAINLVLTSPPYALKFKKAYGNVHADAYVAWFLPFAAEIFRVLPDDGSFVLNLGGVYHEGTPTRSLYQFKLLIALVEQLGFHLAQECFWCQPTKLPMPAFWVAVRRIRIKDAVEYLWWLGKTPWPKANNRAVLRPYGQTMRSYLSKPKTNGVPRSIPSGHVVNPAFETTDCGGSIPHNLLIYSNAVSNESYMVRCKAAGLPMHPARFPAALPEFFIKLLTDEGDLVLDPFAGSNTTGAVAERLQRRWIASDAVEQYLNASKFRFE